MKFFLDLVPPRTTAQQQKTAVINGRPRRYDPKSVKAARALYMAALAPHRPREPYSGPLRLTVRWQFPRGRRRAGWKTTRPDTDNLQKLLKDCMTAAGFWRDDALVVSEVVEKVWSDRAGIFVRVEVLE